MRSPPVETGVDPVLGSSAGALSTTQRSRTAAVGSLDAPSRSAASIQHPGTRTVQERTLHVCGPGWRRRLGGRRRRWRGPVEPTPGWLARVQPSVRPPHPSSASPAAGRSCFALAVGGWLHTHTTACTHTCTYQDIHFHSHTHSSAVALG